VYTLINQCANYWRRLGSKFTGTLFDKIMTRFSASDAICT